jgi:hypothetical protein
VSDRDFVAANTLDRRTRRLLRHLWLVGVFLHDRVPARERVDARIGDLAASCLPPTQVDPPARSDSTGDPRAA